MGVQLKPETGSDSRSGDQLLKSGNAERRAAFAHEHERTCPGFALETAQRAQLTAGDRVCARRTTFGSADVQTAALEVDLIPAQPDQLGGSQTVSEGNKDHGCIAVAISIVLGGLDQLLDLGFGQVFAGAILGVRTSTWSNCPFYGGWSNQSEMQVCHGI
jgi:hypothetical protein